MALQYLNYLDGEVYEQGTGSRLSYKLSADTIESTIEYQAAPTAKGYLRLIWHGTFKYINNKLAESSISDFSYTVGDGLAY